MSEFQFVDGGGNLQSKGFIIQQKYMAVGRNESVKNPGNFFVTLQGPGLPEEGVAIWESSLAKEFIPAPPVAAPIQQPPVQQAPVQQAPIQQAPVAATHQPLPQPQVSQPIPELVEIAKALYSLRSLVEGMSAAVSPAAIQAQAPAGVDLFLSGLLKLKFETLELKFSRDDTGTVLRVILDSTTPLGIKVDNLAAATVVEQIVNAFSENTMVISAIADWQKMLVKAEAEKREAVKKAKDEAAKKPEGTTASAKGTGQKATGKPAAAAPVAQPATEPEEPEEETQGEPEEPEQPTDGAIYPTPVTEVAAEGNGTSDEVAKFKLF